MTYVWLSSDESHKGWFSRWFLCGPQSSLCMGWREIHQMIARRILRRVPILSRPQSFPLKHFPLISNEELPNGRIPPNTPRFSTWTIVFMN